MLYSLFLNTMIYWVKLRSQFFVFGQHEASSDGGLWTFPSYLSYIIKMLARYARPVRRKFYLFGLGNRIEGELTEKQLILRVGWSDKVEIWVGHRRLLRFEKFTWRRSKQTFLCRTSSLEILSALTFLIRKLNSPDVYQGSGIRFVRETFHFRKRKKWGVF